MKKLLAIAITSVTLITPIFTYANTEAGSTYVSDAAKVHYHYSQLVGQLYEFNVSLPNNYHNEPDREYPVVYVLDGQWDFTLVANITGRTTADGMVPDVITVAITWGGEADDAELLRSRDFVPSKFPFIPNSGGADTFLEAMEFELMPYINSIYRNNDETVLMGNSLGGLFTSYVMFEKPELFDGYIAMSAPYSLEADYFNNKMLLTQGSDYLQNIRAYFAVGNLDLNSTSVEYFVGQLKESGYIDLEIENKTIENAGHAVASINGYTQGLQYIFQRDELTLPIEILNQYQGTYDSDLDQGFPSFIVASIGNEMTIQFPDYPLQTFKAKSETEFYLKGQNVNVEFLLKDKHWIVQYNVDGNIYPFTKNTEN